MVACGYIIKVTFNVLKRNNFRRLLVENDLVSIVLPVYNGERYMRESIDSVLSQTYNNWELLILDDCSTDSTPAIAQEYVMQDDRIKYYRNEKNLRLPKNLNKGFQLAKGDFLTWTSDDNRFKPTALEKMYCALKSNQNAQFVFASCRVIDEEGKEIEYIMVSENSKKTIVGSNPVGACFMYTRKAYETVGEYDPELTLVEDFDYWQRLFSKFGAITICDILYEYRWHSGALTSTMKKDQFNKNLETMLLKNRPAFGKLDFEEKYYFYRGLNKCRVNLGELKNPYTMKYKLYSILYFIKIRVPNKIRRMIKYKK